MAEKKKQNTEKKDRETQKRKTTAKKKKQDQTIKKTTGASSKKTVQKKETDQLDSAKVHYDTGYLTDYDVYLFKEGNHYTLYEKLGAHIISRNDKNGVFFAVWAPNAKSVSVIGDFNYWAAGEHLLKAREDGSGIWEGFIEGLDRGNTYKYHIVSSQNNYIVEKADPYANYSEQPPKTASRVWSDQYEWNDKDWMNTRQEKNSLHSPMSVYELHFESWRRIPEESMRPLSYREMAHQLVDYLKEMEYTHVELLPVMEHPFSGSWGYQVLGFFAPTSRFGSPEEFKYFVDTLHQNDIGVILDWVPSHFPGDLHGIHFFDGTYLYEHHDPKQGFHPDWSSYIFNYGRNEVKAFLISSAHYWLGEFHIDGLRVDAVASMLYLDYSRKEGEWIPNKYGGRENLEAIDFLRDLNESVYTRFPGIQTIAEESTSWPMVTRPVYTGGLGFGFKWNMGWMHDTLNYISRDPIYRSFHHNEVTFSIWYAFSENFMLSLSHDEVVHGKGSLINKMPGDIWQKFANLRLLYGYMISHPGKKLTFMGNEFGQWDEWSDQKSLDWHLLHEGEHHRGLKQWVRDLNRTYKSHPALYENDFEEDGFRWIDANDSKNSILSYARFDINNGNPVMVICNFTPEPHGNYRIGVKEEGKWEEILNSDAREYGGSGQGNFGGVEAFPVPYHGEEYSINVHVPPLGIVMFARKST